jgi:hypothetical protein
LIDEYITEDEAGAVRELLKAEEYAFVLCAAEGCAEEYAFVLWAAKTEDWADEYAFVL